MRTITGNPALQLKANRHFTAESLLVAIEECFFAALVKIGFKGTAFFRMAKVLSVELAHYRGQGLLQLGGCKYVSAGQRQCA